MNTEVSNFLASREYSEATKTIYTRVLEELAPLDLTEWGASNLLSFVQRDSWGNAWRCAALYACRSFIRWKYGSLHPALTAKLKRTKPKAQRSMSADQVLSILASFDTFTAMGARDQAIFATALDTGFRVSELARIQLADVSLEDGTIQVLIKGAQWGFGFLSTETTMILDRWLSYRRDITKCGALFITLKENKRRGSQMQAQGIQTLFKRWGIKAGFKLSAHDARRSFATLSTENGAPSRLLQSAGRWSDIKMVERYTANLNGRAVKPFLPMANLSKPTS